VAVWNEVKTQWRGGGMGLIGLDYSEVRHAFDALGIDKTRRNWRKIQAIERMVLNSVNRRDK
jgi:hypothetical protein